MKWNGCWWAVGWSDGRETLVAAAANFADAVQQGRAIAGRADATVIKKIWRERGRLVFTKRNVRTAQEAAA